MINLLPDGYKKELLAARSNVVLLRYNFLFLGLAAFVLASSLVVYALLGNAEGQAKATNSDNNSRATQYAGTEKEANDYRKNLTTAAKILDNEVNYTDRVFAITNLLPSGVVLDSLSLNAKDFGTPTVLNAHAKDYNAVTALKSAFQASPTVFSNVHFQSITNDGGGTTGAAYPISVGINVTMNKADRK